jgi:hypothetical protein
MVLMVGDMQYHGCLGVQSTAGRSRNGDSVSISIIKFLTKKEEEYEGLTVYVVRVISVGSTQRDAFVACPAQNDLPFWRALKGNGLLARVSVFETISVTKSDPGVAAWNFSSSQASLLKTRMQIHSFRPLTKEKAAKTPLASRFGEWKQCGPRPTATTHEPLRRTFSRLANPRSNS